LDESETTVGTAVVPKATGVAATAIAGAGFVSRYDARVVERMRT
jgi:hypothetical protein